MSGTSRIEKEIFLEIEKTLTKRQGKIKEIQKKIKEIEENKISLSFCISFFTSLNDLQGDYLLVEQKLQFLTGYMQCTKNLANQTKEEEFPSIYEEINLQKEQLHELSLKIFAMENKE
ncbi:hypothetical protein SAMN02745116_01535 [Pilibacter termitis]|uniref:Uncharacterized protein n=2 Tax=Pilibacter termitis TaxID=263852 RepID=A0A1T4NSJ7_9ENTE|nr:hypothetical protein SAMN02745116_01535 [Pilibacter termitis]